MLVWFAALGAHAQQVRFDFETDTFCISPTASLDNNGDAYFETAAPDCALVLTDAIANQTGSAFSLSTLPLGASSVIRTRFRVTISGGVGTTGGSGLAFGLYGGASSSLGTGASGLGWGGLSPSVALELDTFLTAVAADPDANHLGFNQDGSITSLVTASSPFDINGTAGGVYVWVEYHQLEQQFRVFSDTVNTQPATPLLDVSIDLLSAVGSAPRVGFSAGTATSTNQHRIDSWLLEMDNDIDGDGVMDFEDLCRGDDAIGDTDGDGRCDDLDPCPIDPLDDSDNDTLCDSVDQCPGLDDLYDGNGDAIPDCLEKKETSDTSAPADTGVQSTGETGSPPQDTASIEETGTGGSGLSDPTSGDTGSLQSTPADTASPAPDPDTRDPLPPLPSSPSTGIGCGCEIPARSGAIGGWMSLFAVLWRRRSPR